MFKKYSNPEDDIKLIGDSVESHAKKQVQMHCLAKKLADDMLKHLDSAKKDFGTNIIYSKVYLGKWNGGYITVEEFIEGTFEKYINNNGDFCFMLSILITNKAEAYVHFTYERSKSQLVLDIQGVVHVFTDPEIAWFKQFVGDEDLFCGGNLFSNVIENFKSQHNCNVYCEMAQLTPF